MQHLCLDFYYYLCAHKIKIMMLISQNHFFSVSYVIVVIGIMVVVFSISIVFMMAYDYHIYLAGNRRRKFSFADFIKREQYYLYILVFFLLIITGELLRNNLR